ncbi:hypothetical protein GW17_00035920 [Ensete ventricosum]|nr:hypothetical protein GW17_00035920 [Ensete ventricosum]
MVNGLLKTAQGPPPGAPTTLVPPQDVTMKFEAMKCLVAILRSMGDWMNKQLRIPDPYSQNTEITDGNTGGSNELPLGNGNISEEPAEVHDSHSETANGTSEVASIELRRAYKLELQMSPDDFIRNNRGIDDGKDLPEEYLRSLSAYYSATDVVILRFMIEVCWAPMLAAFSVPLDQSDDETVISLCLEGFRSAVHVTAVMSMETQRDAFVTSLAKFTSLHSAADIKQKNIDAIKELRKLILFVKCFQAILYIADEDGNYLQEAWEHVLTCVSRFEHLHLLGEGAPPDATFFTIQQTELDTSNQTKSSILTTTKKKGPSSVVARRGTYDSASVSGQASGVVTSEQMNNLISNLNLLEQVGIAEVNRIFVRSEKLNSEAIINFVKALCKVSMEELRSASDPRVFSLTKIVEIA